MVELGSYNEILIEEEENHCLVSSTNSSHGFPTKELVSQRRGWGRFGSSLFWALGCLFLLRASVVSTRLFACPLDSSLVYCELTRYSDATLVD